MAISFVEGQVVSNGTGVAATPLFTNTFAVGQLVVVTIAYDGGADATTSVVDNASTSNTYTVLPSFGVGNGSTAYLQSYYSIITTAKASPKVTVNFNSAATSVNVAVQYFNGFTGTPTLDKLHSQLNATSTTATSGATAATTQAIELVVGMAMHTSTVSAFSLGSGYTNLTQSSVAARQVAIESLITSATAAQTATFTIAATRVNIGGVATFYDQPTTSAPTVTDSAATSITSFTAVGNGNVTSDGGSTITVRGFAYALTANPTTSSSTVTTSGTTGAYTATMTGLVPGQLYHYRAYATNAIGTSYGADQSFTTTLSFSWKGYTWWRRDYTGSPMYNNNWSPSNISDPDGSNYVTLSITNPSGTSPIAAEIFSNGTTWGYGTYMLVVGSRVDALPAGVVWGGLFTYDDTTLTGNTAVTNNEIDLNETSDWGNGITSPIQTDHNYFYNNAGVKTENPDYFTPTTDVVTTHVFTWSPGQIVFDSYSGTGTGGTNIRHTARTTNIPVPANEFVDINLWVTAGTANTPSTTPATSIIIRDFSFVPFTASTNLFFF